MASIKDLLSPIDEQATASKEGTGQEKYLTERPGTQHSSAAETTHFTIEFILDTICPHCYIGLRSLNTAIEIYRKQHPEATFEVTCSPMVLNPHATRSGKFMVLSYHSYDARHHPAITTRKGQEGGVARSILLVHRDTFETYRDHISLGNSMTWVPRADSDTPFDA